MSRNDCHITCVIFFSSEALQKKCETSAGLREKVRRIYDCIFNNIGAGCFTACVLLQEIILPKD